MSDMKTEETADTSSHSVVVSRLVHIPVRDVWHRLVTDKSENAILGEGLVLGDKGDSWKAADGTFGVVRSYHPLEQIRFSWHASEGATRTIVDVRVEPVTDSETTVEIRHERLDPQMDRDTIQQRWEQALSRF